LRRCCLIGHDSTTITEFVRRKQIASLSESTAREAEAMVAQLLMHMKEATSARGEPLTWDFWVGVAGFEPAAP
jgi:hypothetical protein